jgi:hypothetical protein
MLSDMTASPITSITADPPVPSATEAGPMVDLGRRVPVTSRFKWVGKLLRGIALAPTWPLGTFLEAQALLGLPIRTVFENQDFLWRRHQQGDLYEPDPFAAESPFQRDSWPF